MNPVEHFLLSYILVTQAALLAVMVWVGLRFVRIGLAKTEKELKIEERPQARSSKRIKTGVYKPTIIDGIRMMMQRDKSETIKVNDPKDKKRIRELLKSQPSYMHGMTRNTADGPFDKPEAI